MKDTNSVGRHNIYGINRLREIIFLFSANSALVPFRSCMFRNGSFILKKELRVPASYANPLVKFSFAFPCSQGNFGVSIIKTTCHGNNDHKRRFR
jgi:hypothetical protein